MYKHLPIGVLLGCMIFMTPHAAVAGPFADDMAKCLVKSASDADRADLMRWMFSAMSLHPDLASMAKISEKERDEANAKVAKLFSRLMFESCRSEVVQALRNEGPTTIVYAFQILGQVAARGIMTDTHVTQSMQALNNGVDQAKLKELLAEASKK